METSDVSRIFENDDFGFWSVTVERPLRLRVCPDNVIPENVFKNAEERDSVKEAISSVPGTTTLDDWTMYSKATKLKVGVLKKIRPYITVKDETAKPIKGEADVDLRDSELIPFTYNGGIDAFFENEVLAYSPDAWIDDKKTSIGYEISFTKVFYKPLALRDISDVLNELKALENDADGMIVKITGGIVDGK